MYSDYPKSFEIYGAIPFPEAAKSLEIELPPLTPENVAMLNRAGVEMHHKAYEELGIPFPDVEVKEFTYRNGSYEGEGKVYRPKTDEVLPVVVYYHGGAFTILSYDNYDYECAQFAQEANCVVFNIEYRAALGGFKIPELYEDCYAALCAAAEKAGDYKADASKLTVMGDSAGGSIAAGMCVLSRDRKGPHICHQFFFYMGVGFDLNETANGNDSPLGTENILRICFNDPQDSQAPHISLLNDKKEDMAKLPPATFFDGLCDFIIDDTLQYSYALRDAGVKTDIIMFEGLVHGFINSTYPQALEARKTVFKKLRQYFDTIR